MRIKCDMCDTSIIKTKEKTADYIDLIRSHPDLKYEKYMVMVCRDCFDSVFSFVKPKRPPRNEK